MRKKILATIATAGAVICLAACGGSSASSGQPGSGVPSAQTLVNDAFAALKAAHSLRVSGGVVESGKGIHLDVGFIKPSSANGTLSGSLSGFTATFKLIITGGKGYILIDKSFFGSLAKEDGLPASACSAVCGKYIEVPASQFGDFSLNGLTNSMLKAQDEVGSGVTVTSIDGQPAYKVSDGHGSYLYIAENGTHYPLEVTKPGTGTLTFSQWNSVPPITAPPASQVTSLP